MQNIETVTVLITDVVGSTAMESRIGPARANELHFQLIRGAVEDAGGKEVKNTGDGLIVVFRSTVAAVSCAVAVQQRFDRRNRSAEEPLLVRVGLSCGDATVASITGIPK
jgi:class 3 adenylate cyclase